MYFKCKTFDLENAQFGFSIIFEGKKRVYKYRNHVNLLFSIKLYFDFWKKRLWIAFSKRDKNDEVS